MRHKFAAIRSENVRERAFPFAVIPVQEKARIIARRRLLRSRLRLGSGRLWAGRLRKHRRSCGQRSNQINYGNESNVTLLGHFQSSPVEGLSFGPRQNFLNAPAPKESLQQGGNQPYLPENNRLS